MNCKKQRLIFSLVILFHSNIYIIYSENNNSALSNIVQNIINSKKILIIGCTGSGKTTLALTLSEKLKLPIYHLDILQWRPGWIPAPTNEYLLEQKEIMQQKKWILEGNDVKCLPDQISHAEVVIFLDIPQWDCLKNAIIRHWCYNKKVRPGTRIGCPSKFDCKLFIDIAWRYNRNKRPQIINILNEAKKRLKEKIFIYIPTSLKDIKALTDCIFMQQVKNS